MEEYILDPVHPGEILLEEYMKPLKLTQYALAKAISVPPRRINEIIHGKRGISADTALRLGKFFGVDPQSWMNLQTHYDLEIVEKKLAIKLILKFMPLICMDDLSGGI